MHEAKHDVLTVAELAEYLKVPKSTVYKLAQEGSLPAQKVGKHWRFHRDAIDEWLSGQLEGPEALERRDSSREEGRADVSTEDP
jgi:excisionase family DNA binding protein